MKVDAFPVESKSSATAAYKLQHTEMAVSSDKQSKVHMNGGRTNHAYRKIAENQASRMCGVVNSTNKLKSISIQCFFYWSSVHQCSLLCHVTSTLAALVTGLLYHSYKPL